MSVDGKVVMDQKEMVDTDCKLKIIGILGDKRIDKKTSFKDIRQAIADNSISDFADVYKLLYDKIDGYATGHLAPVILILAQMEYQSAFVIDREINFMATIIQILEVVKT